MYVYCSLFTTKENNQSGKNGFTIYYVRTEVEIIVLKLWKKKYNFQYKFAILTVISVYRSICLLSHSTRIYVCPTVSSLCLSDTNIASTYWTWNKYSDFYVCYFWY